MIMTQKVYSLIAGLLFGVVALVHLWRIVIGWDVTAYGTVIPIWVSWAGFIITGILAIQGLCFGLQRK